MSTIKKLIIKTPQGTSGVLSKDGRFSFRYENQNDASCEISLTMPLRFNDYASTNLHPVFESCRPEGFLLERLTKKLLKFGKVDDLRVRRFV